MAKLVLPFTRTEEHFWRAIAKRLVQKPGLILAVVPRDWNTVKARQYLRQLLCYPDEHDSEMHGYTPHGRQVFGVDFSTEDTGTPQCITELLPQALAKLNIDLDSQPDMADDERFFLLISGISVPQGSSLSQWVREMIQDWPGGQPGNVAMPVHCCWIVSAEQPLGQAPLPEGCDWLMLDAAPNEEIRDIARQAVATIWRAEDRCVQTYLCSGIADMASGQRVHAEQALELLRDEWQDGYGQQQAWRPMWRPGNALVEHVRLTMHDLGIDATWVRARLTEGAAGLQQEDTRLAQRLWEHGLWRNMGGNTSLWHGLTMVARTALQTGEGPGWLVQPAVPDATAQVLVLALRVENQLRYHVLRLMQAQHTRVAVDRVLDEIQRNEGGTQRQRIIDDLERIPDVWGRHWPCVPPERRSDADVLLSMCTFGTLARIVNQLLPRDRCRSWSASLKNVVDARNIAAHGGWFALAEYQAFIHDTARVEADLASLRFA